jgi:hypothetical protein
LQRRLSQGASNVAAQGNIGVYRAPGAAFKVRSVGQQLRPRGTVDRRIDGNLDVVLR